MGHLGTEKHCGSNIASKHSHKHEARPPGVITIRFDFLIFFKVPSRIKQFSVVLLRCWRKQCGPVKKHLIPFELSVATKLNAVCATIA